MNFTIVDSLSAYSIVMDGTTDADGNKWLCVNHDGWDTPKLDLKSTDVTGTHGATFAPSYLTARPVNIEGVCITNGQTGSYAARRKLLAAGMAFPSSMATLSAPSFLNGFTTYLKVATASQPKIKYLNSGGSFTFQLQFLAKFPIRLDSGSYTPLTLVNGSNTAITSGSAPTPPTLTLGGTGGNVTITNSTATGQPSMVMTGLPANAIIDFRAHTIKVGSTSYYEKIVAGSEWWWLVAGSNSIAYSGPSGATLTWQHAWW